MATDKAIQKTKGLVVAANNPYEPGYPCPNVNAVYGPYASIDEAFLGCLGIFDSPVTIPQGTTVGVVEDGKVVEYWFAYPRPEGGYGIQNLIVKQQQSGGVGSDEAFGKTNEQFSTIQNAEQVTLNIQQADGGKVSTTIQPVDNTRAGVMTAQQYITIEELKANAVKKQELATVNMQTLVNGGVNIDTTPEAMTDEDIDNYFKNLKKQVIYGK